MGDREGNPWMQPLNGLWAPEDDTYMMQLENSFCNPEDYTDLSAISTNAYMMQTENGLGNLEDNVDFSNLFPNISMIQAEVGGNGVFQTPLSQINNIRGNGSDYRGHTSAHIPRGGVSMEQIQALGAPPFQVADSNIEPQHLPGIILAEKAQDEPNYVTLARASHVTKRARKNIGPSSEEWAKWEPEIRRVYIDDNCTLKVTMEKMAKKGFHAESVTLHSPWEYYANVASIYRESMYKRRIREWGWRTYELDKDNGKLGGRPTSGKPLKRTRGKLLGPPSTLHEESYPSNSSRGTTMAVVTPPNFGRTHSNNTHFSMEIPALMSKKGIDELMGTIPANVKDLYISHPAQKKWKVQKQREVEEDIHDDLLVGVATSLRNYSSLSPELGYKGFQKALHTLEKVVGVGQGADCGLFSLPAIWESFLRMIRKERLDLAGVFLSRVLQLAIYKFGREHPFVQVLLGLKKVWMTEPAAQLEEVIFKAYRRCITHVKEKLGAFNLTYLCLWGDYVVYLDGSSTNETRDVVDNIRSVIKISEEEKGPDGGPDGDYTLELLGLTLYVLQSAPTMADEAEKVARELLIRVNQRRVKAGGKLEGDLFITWKDLSHTLGTFCQEKKDYQQAVGYLEDFLDYEIVDDRDTLALEKLEKCYVSLGRDDDAKAVWQRRMDSSQRLLQKTNKEPVWDEEAMNDHRERDGDDGGDVSEERGNSSQPTLVVEVEELNEGNLEEDETDEIGDSEVEMQLVQVQIAELQRRLNVLKRKKLVT